MARLLNHLQTEDGCDLADGCRDKIYSRLVPGVNVKRPSRQPCPHCCCPALSQVCSEDPRKQRPWWWDGTDLMDEFFGFALKDLNFENGVLSGFGRFRAANPQALARGMQLYRNVMQPDCTVCAGDLTLRVADVCPGKCDRAGGCGNQWISLHGMTLTEMTPVDDGTRTGCIQPMVVSWQTQCRDGYRPVCSGQICLSDGQALPCDLTVCDSFPGDGCQPCNTQVPAIPPRVYRGCWCRPLTQTAAGARIKVPGSCRSKTALSVKVTTRHPVTNLRIAAWRANPNQAAPWTVPGREFYKNLTPATDIRIPRLEGFETATINPWGPSTLTCQGTVRGDGIEGPLGRPITTATARPGEELLVAVYGDTANGFCLEDVCVSWELNEIVKL